MVEGGKFGYQPEPQEVDPISDEEVFLAQEIVGMLDEEPELVDGFVESSNMIPVSEVKRAIELDREIQHYERNRLGPVPGIATTALTVGIIGVNVLTMANGYTPEELTNALTAISWASSALTGLSVGIYIRELSEKPNIKEAKEELDSLMNKYNVISENEDNIS